MTLSLARRERQALADTAETVGPNAPTLCEGWDATHLLAHLVLREHSLLGAVGIAVAPLARFTDREMTRLANQPYDELVRRVREPGLTPYRLKPVENVANTLEYFVHHEDLRRAQPQWAPRVLPPEDQDVLWSQLKVPARLTGRRAGVPLVLRRSDRPEQSVTLRGGPDPVVVSGLPGELVELMFGRGGHLHAVEFDGPEDAVARVRGADFSA